MKRLISLILALLLCAGLTVSAWAATELVFDQADLLTNSEEAALQEKLEQYSDQYAVQITVVTLPEIDGDIDWYIQEFYDQGDFGYGEDKDGILLMVSMDPREYRILSNGIGADALGLGQIDDICDAMYADMRDGNYADAFDTFVTECDYYLDIEENGAPFQLGQTLLAAVVTGFVVGLIVALCLKRQLKSVRPQNRANVYMRPGSMRITQSGDYFMYRNVVRTPRPQNNSSSSGSSRNVGGRSF